MNMIEILKQAVSMGASDIHIVIGLEPMIRVQGVITVLDGFIPINADESQRMIYSLLTDEQRVRFEQDWELDCSFALPQVSRFRLNVFKQRNGTEAVMRIIPAEIPTPQQLGLSPTILSFTDMPRGLVLVTGPSGAGKSTTLACLLNEINHKRPGNVLTIEDPIEYVYDNNQCIIRQREVDHQTKSFSIALKHAMRQDPDVVLIGEMRDLETISAALTIAETGQLVFGTLHTSGASQTIDRIIDVFPPHQQNQVRAQLSTTLRGVVSQVLLPHSSGRGRIAAREVMVITPGIANMIREGDAHQIASVIETGSKFGMISMDRSLVNLMQSGDISLEAAISKAYSVEYIKSEGRMGPGTGR